MENVVQIPLALERLAIQISHDLEACKLGLEKTEQGRRQWIEGAYDLCLHLAEAREQHSANADFGQWCADNGFGEDVINSNTRAASIAMGREPEALRKCLEATERRSLQHIYRHEFERFCHVTKTPKPPRQSRRRLQTDDLLVAREAVRPLIKSNQPIHREKLAAELGVSVAAIHQADHQERGRLEALEEVKALPPDEMSAPMKQRYEAALRKAEKELRFRIKGEVFNEISTEYEVYLAHWRDKVARAERILAAHKGVMSRQQFRIVLAGLHPDHNTFEQASEAFELFLKLEDVLVRPEAPEPATPPLPKTIAEMMEMKRQASEARKAKRQQREGVSE